MSLPLADGLAVLYVLCREWMADREIRAGLGVKNPDRLDEILAHRPAARGKLSTVAAMGGETG